MAKKRHFENDFYESLDLTEGKRGHNNEFLWWSNLHIFCFLFNSNTYDLISNRNLRLIWWNDKKIHRYPGKQLLFLHVTNTTPFSHSETLVVLVLYKEGIGEWVVRIYQKTFQYTIKILKFSWSYSDWLSLDLRDNRFNSIYFENWQIQFM